MEAARQQASEAELRLAEATPTWEQSRMLAEAAARAEAAAGLAMEHGESKARRTALAPHGTELAETRREAEEFLRNARHAHEEAIQAVSDSKDKQDRLPPPMHWLLALIFRSEYRRREAKEQQAFDEFSMAQKARAEARRRFDLAEEAVKLALKAQHDHTEQLELAISAEARTTAALELAKAGLPGDVRLSMDEAEQGGGLTAFRQVWTDRLGEARGREQRALDTKLAAERRRDDTERAAAHTAEMVAALEAAIATAAEHPELSRLRARNRVADSNFLQQQAQERELASPWMSEELRDARVRLFLAALHLHKAFILGAWSKISTNLGAMMDVLKGTISEKAAPYLRDLWASLFLAVPVVSSTFASFGRLFRGLGKESIGWLFVDEAGQATPQQAVGALWRSQRALIIGDPLQVEPVVTTPAKLISLLRREFGALEAYAPDKTSAQCLADAANPVGATKFDGRWVGCPLSVHRRCADPMFTIANQIAYENRMVHGWSVDDTFKPLFGDSCWIDIQGMANGKHWIPEEGELAARMAHAALRVLDQKKGEKIYVITPFCSVKEHFHTLMAATGDWAKFNVGTVHTFQGKEAETVILLLGSGTDGARNWASGKPNLLNVAVTRAKIRLHVIGNYAQWSDKPFFNAAAQLGPPLSAEEFEARLAAESSQNRVSMLAAPPTPPPSGKPLWVSANRESGSCPRTRRGNPPASRP